MLICFAYRKLFYNNNDNNNNCFRKKECITREKRSELLVLKLNITDLKANYKRKHENALCRRCGGQEETIKNL